MDNRRKFVRVDYELLTSYSHCEALAGSDEGVAKTLNLSVGGLLLQLPRSVDVGAQLQLALSLDGEIVEVVGTAVRCLPAPNTPDMYEVGVELTSVADRFVTTLEGFFSE